MINPEQQARISSKPRLAYTRIELASLMGISTKILQRLENRGLIRSSKALRKKLYSHREVIRFLEQV